MARTVGEAVERRASVRWQPGVSPRPITCRIRPGHEARVVDVCERGALLDTCRRLAPGAMVELQWESGDRREQTRARVVRCSVTQVRPDLLVYRGAVCFERHVPWMRDGVVELARVEE